MKIAQPVHRWHIAEQGFATETVILKSSGLYACTCSAYGATMLDCRHVLKVKGVKNSATLRLYFVNLTAEGAQPAPSQPKQQEKQQPSGPIRKVELD